MGKNQLYGYFKQQTKTIHNLDMTKKINFMDKTIHNLDMTKKEED